MDVAKEVLEKFGWKEGRGLGKEETGRKEAVKSKLKFDRRGIGSHGADDFTNNWWEAQYNRCAANLQLGERTPSKQPTKNPAKEEITPKVAKPWTFGRFVSGGVLHDENAKDDPANVKNGSENAKNGPENAKNGPENAKNSPENSSESLLSPSSIVQDVNSTETVKQDLKNSKNSKQKLPKNSEFNAKKSTKKSKKRKHCELSDVKAEKLMLIKRKQLRINRDS